MSTESASYQLIWEAFHKINKLKLGLTTLAQSLGSDEVWQLIVLVNEAERDLYEALDLRRRIPMAGRD